MRFVVHLVQRQGSIAGALAFWMANSSELLNFLKHDRELSPLTQQSQLDLSNLVHKAYKSVLQRAISGSLTGVFFFFLTNHDLIIAVF